MVGSIERFRAELQVGALAQTELLHGGKVPVDDAGADDRITAGVAIAVLRLAGQPVHERPEVEEPAGILLTTEKVRIDADVVGIAAAVVVLDGTRATEGRQGEAV